MSPPGREQVNEAVRCAFDIGALRKATPIVTQTPTNGESSPSSRTRLPVGTHSHERLAAACPRPSTPIGAQPRTYHQIVRRRPAYGFTHWKSARTLVWTAFVGLALLLAVMLHALATHLSEMPQQAEPSDICLTPNPITVALADGDDVRARFLANLCSAPTEVAPAQ